VVAKGVEYLDGLAREARGDPELERELVAAYIKMGDVEGNLYQSNMGNPQAAKVSYGKALTISEAVQIRHPADITNRQLTARARVKIADLDSISGDRDEALRGYRIALNDYRQLHAAQGNTREALLNVLNVCLQIGSTYDQLRDYPKGLEAFRECLPVARALADVDPATGPAVALTKERIAYLSTRCGVSEGAEREIVEALEIYRRMAETKPGPRTQRNLAKGLKTLAEVQRAGGHIPAALENARKSLAIIDELYARDPKDKLVQVDLHMGLVLLVDLLIADKRLPEARRQTARALRFLQPLIEHPQPALHDLQDYVLLLVSTPFPDLRDGPAAVRYAQRAVQMTSAKDVESLELLARAQALTRNYRDASLTARQAIALLAANGADLPSSPLRTALENNAAAFEALALRHSPAAKR
jgi:tetratricopeptide (TPR) repeat protein